MFSILLSDFHVNANAPLSLLTLDGPPLECRLSSVQKYENLVLVKLPQFNLVVHVSLAIKENQGLVSWKYDLKQK